MCSIMSVTCPRAFSMFMDKLVAFSLERIIEFLKPVRRFRMVSENEFMSFTRSPSSQRSIIDTGLAV